MNFQEAEVFLIGGLIAKPENFGKVRDKVSAFDFSEEIFQKTFGAFEEIDSIEGIPLDCFTIKSSLREILKPGEYEILFKTIEDDIGANESLPFWARQVRRGRIEREIKSLANERIDKGRLDSLLITRRAEFHGLCPWVST